MIDVCPPGVASRFAFVDSESTIRNPTLQDSNTNISLREYPYQEPHGWTFQSKYLYTDIYLRIFIYEYLYPNITLALAWENGLDSLGRTWDNEGWT